MMLLILPMQGSIFIASKFNGYGLRREQGGLVLYGPGKEDSILLERPDKLVHTERKIEIVYPHEALIIERAYQRITYIRERKEDTIREIWCFYDKDGLHRLLGAVGRSDEKSFALFLRNSKYWLREGVEIDRIPKNHFLSHGDFISFIGVSERGNDISLPIPREECILYIPWEPMGVAHISGIPLSKLMDIPSETYYHR